MEFTKFSRIETDANGEQICRVFYTDPYKSRDKAQCERNHELIRYLLPKHKSMSHLTQEDVDEVFSNINSYIRASKGNKTPYELFEAKYGREVLNKLGIKKIRKKKVRLTAII